MAKSGGLPLSQVGKKAYDGFDDFINSLDEESYKYLGEHYGAISSIWSLMADKDLFYELFMYLSLNNNPIDEPYVFAKFTERWSNDAKDIPLSLYLSLNNNEFQDDVEKRQKLLLRSSKSK